MQFGVILLDKGPSQLSRHWSRSASILNENGKHKLAAAALRSLWLKSAQRSAREKLLDFKRCFIVTVSKAEAKMALE